MKDELRFVFHGYAVWLETEQFSTSSAIHTKFGEKNDLDLALQVASQELNVVPIPAPHLTALYGISHLGHEEIRQRFRDLTDELKGMVLPIMQPSGFLSDVEIEGENGGQMSMAWMETSYKTSEKHEGLIDRIHQCFYKGTHKTRIGPWVPHISLAYDNEECPIPQSYLDDLLGRFPSLAYPRRIRSVSLWDLNGTIDQWTLVDRACLDMNSSPIVSDEEEISDFSR